MLCVWLHVATYAFLSARAKHAQLLIPTGQWTDFCQLMVAVRLMTPHSNRILDTCMPYTDSEIAERLVTGLLVNRMHASAYHTVPNTPHSLIDQMHSRAYICQFTKNGSLLVGAPQS